MVRAWWLAIALAVTGSPALADMTAHYVEPREVVSLTIEIADNGDARSQGIDPQSYFLWRGGQAYQVRATAEGPEVMRLEDMVAAMAARAGPSDPAFRDEMLSDKPGRALVAGRPVTVNGRPGIPYRSGRAGRRADGRDVRPCAQIISAQRLNLLIHKSPPPAFNGRPQAASAPERSRDGVDPKWWNGIVARALRLRQGELPVDLSA